MNCLHHYFLLFWFLGIIFWLLLSQMRIYPQILSSHALLKSATLIVSHGYSPTKIIYNQSMSFIIIAFPFLYSFFPRDNNCFIFYYLSFQHPYYSSPHALHWNKSPSIVDEHIRNPWRSLPPMPDVTGVIFSRHMALRSSLDYCLWIFVQHPPGQLLSGPYLLVPES